MSLNRKVTAPLGSSVIGWPARGHGPSTWHPTRRPAWSEARPPHKKVSSLRPTVSTSTTERSVADEHRRPFRPRPRNGSCEVLNRPPLDDRRFLGRRLHSRGLSDDRSRTSLEDFIPLSPSASRPAGHRV